MKKIFAICMAALLMLAALPVSLVLADEAVNAGNPIQISGTVDKAAACAGQEIVLAINIAQNPGLTGWNVIASFDESAFELLSLTYGTIFPESGLSQGPMKSPASVTFVDALKPNVNGDGVLYYATFKVKADAADGDYTITLGAKDDDLEQFMDAEWNLFAVEFTPVTVKVGHNYVANKTKNEDCGNDGVMTYTCACGATYTETVPATGAHTYANDCDADCNVCGATRTPADHVYDNDCDADCNVCGAGRTAADHVYDNACDADCNVCGATRATAGHKSNAAFACEAGVCTECGADVPAADHVYTYACDAHCAVCGNLTNANAAHETVKIDAAEPDCHRVGNKEYWTCVHCGNVWEDEAMTIVSNRKNIIIPALGGEVKHVEAKAATVDAEGNIEYWFCETCEQFWADEALTQLTNSKNVIIGKLEAEPTTAPTTKPEDTQAPTKPMGENVTVILVSGMIALLAAAAVVLSSKKKA